MAPQITRLGSYGTIPTYDPTFFLLNKDKQIQKAVQMLEKGEWVIFSSDTPFGVNLVKEVKKKLSGHTFHEKENLGPEKKITSVYLKIRSKH